MYLNPNEANLLECSIFHYFIWRHDEANCPMKDAEQKDNTTAAVDTSDNSPSRCYNHLRNNNYKRIIQVLKKELPHVATAMSKTPTTSLSSSTPEVCFRWMKYTTIRKTLVNTEIPGNNKKRKRDTADKTERLAKALKSTPEEVNKLENAKEVHFESRFQQLVEYKQEFGHCQVGKECNPGLYQWVNRYRLHFRNGSKYLTPERIAKFDALGMVWEPVRLPRAPPKSIPEKEISLENAKEVLSDLREEHTEVKKITDSLESKLTKSEKIYSELLKFNKEKLRLEKRLEKLQSVEEAKTTEQILDDQQATTTEQIILSDDNHNGKATETILESEEATTIEQKLDNQHVKVTAELGEGDQSNVRAKLDVRAKLETKKRRLQLQESMYANAILYEVHHEKNKQTEAINNSKKQMDFESRLQELIEFKQEFGHCQVGKGKHPSLYSWLERQRQYYRLKKPILSPERIAKLDALGVVWDLGSKPRTIDAHVEQCRKFKEAHGHLRIPLVTERNEDGTEPTEDDVRFRIWAQSMRKQYQKLASGGQAGLDKHRIAMLDSIGFQWTIDTTSVEGDNNDIDNLTPNEIMFRTRIEQLRKVKEIHGNCNDKKHILSVYPNNNAIIGWIKQQRKCMKKLLAGTCASLTEERQEMLRSIEFDFEPRKNFTLPPSHKKTWPTKMEILALEIQEKKKNNHNSENHSEYDDSDIE